MTLQQTEAAFATVVAWITAATGMAQILVPSLLLPIIARQPHPLAAHLLATLGMFMVLFGGMLLHAQRRPAALPVVLVWAAGQKVGAAVFVGWGVAQGHMVAVALAIAAFDMFSGLVLIDLRRRMRGTR